MATKKEPCGYTQTHNKDMHKITIIVELTYDHNWIPPIIDNFAHCFWIEKCILFEL